MAGPPGATKMTPTPSRPMVLRCIGMTIVALIVLFGLAVLIVWLTLRPKVLVYSVEDASVHGFSMNDRSLNATFGLTIRAYNPNTRIGLYYDSILVSVLYEDQIIAFTYLSPFFQHRRNVTHLQAKVLAQSVPLLQQVSQNLKHDRSKGDLELEIKVKAKIRFRVGTWKSDHYTLKASCDNTVVHFDSSKQFDRTFCDVDI